MHYCDLHSLTTDLKFPCSSFLNIFVAYGNKCYKKNNVAQPLLITFLGLLCDFLFRRLESLFNIFE